MSRALDEIVERSRRILDLDYGELARAPGVHQATLYRWRTGEKELSGRARRRLGALAHLLDRVECAFPDPAQCREWLHGPLAVFGGQSPRELLQTGRSELLAGFLLGRGVEDPAPGSTPEPDAGGVRMTPPAATRSASSHRPSRAADPGRKIPRRPVPWAGWGVASWRPCARHPFQ